MTFKGSGEVDWLRILDASGTEVWREDFYNTPAIAGCFTPFPACTNTNTATLNPANTAPDCANNVLSLFSNPSPSFSTYSWTGPAGFSSTQQNPVINNPVTANVGTYIVTGQLDGCAPVITGTAAVNFSIPSIISNNIPDITINNGDTVQLTASGGTSYNWTPNTNFSSTTISNPFVWPSTTANYIVTITKGSCIKGDKY